MIITGDDMQGIQDLKHFLGRQFEMKDLGPFNYFLGLEVSSSADGYYLTQAKYTYDLISQASITDSKIVDTLIEYNYVTPSTRHPMWMSSEGATLRDCDSYSLTFSFSELTPAFICTNSVITKILFYIYIIHTTIVAFIYSIPIY